MAFYQMVAEHTEEPELGTIRDNDFSDERVRWNYVAKCAYCGDLIESNEPEEGWYHVD